MRYLTIGSLLLMFGTALGQEWQLPQQVSPLDTPASQPACVFDRTGQAWVVYNASRLGEPYRLWYHRWLGDRWSDRAGVVPRRPEVDAHLKPSLTVDDAGHIWVVWCNGYGPLNDIGYSIWAGDRWLPEGPVGHRPNSIPHYSPYIASGGGELWCVWYGGLTNHYAVYASRWDPEQKAWTPETQVSPPDGNLHWWCNVAVDARGTPHVFWVEYPHYLLLYSFWDGEQWTGPESVNDTTEFTVSPWGNPQIAIDNTGVFHVSVTGARKGAQYRDILYTRNAGTGWEPMQMVTQSSYHEWYADIAADRPDNVWVVYDRQNEGPDRFRVYARHYDGEEWSAEEWLDDDANENRTPRVALDHQGLPWVVWNRGAPGSSVHFTRKAFAGTTEPEGKTVAFPGLRLHTRVLTEGVVAIEYQLPSAGNVLLELYDGLGRRLAVLDEGRRSEGRHEVRWDAGKAPDGRLAHGAYFVRLRTEESWTTAKVVLVR